MMGELILALGALTALLCAVLLIRRYLANRLRLLLWSGLCFAGLTLNNSLLFVDMVIVPDVSLFRLRLVIVALSMGVLLVGMIWDSE